MFKKEWIKGKQGVNLKFKREWLLNDVMDNWGLNKTERVGTTSKLIRECSPSSLNEWRKFYFQRAIQNKKNGIKITRSYLKDIGKELFGRLSQNAKADFESIVEQECIDYVYNLVINRTYEGYLSEAVYIELQEKLGVKIQRAPDEWDRRYNVDFFIKVKNKYIGLQVKPAGQATITQIHKEIRFQKETHKKFTVKYGGKVFYIISVKKGENRVIKNKEEIKAIKKEIKKLSKNRFSATGLRLLKFTF